MNKRYRLNQDWNGHEKGFVFEATKQNVIYSLCDGTPISMCEPVIDLLIKSGALTPIEDVELPEEIKHSYPTKEPLKMEHEDYSEMMVFETINQIIRYLKSKERLTTN